MAIETIIFLIIGLVVGGIAVFFLLKNKDKEPQADSFLLLQNQIENLTKSVESKLGISNKEMQEAVRSQFSESQRLIQNITEKLTRVDEGQKQVSNVAEQLKMLQNTLQNPKQRGVLGEYYLDTVLKNVLAPGQFQLQYKFSDGDIVDAVIFLDQRNKDKILPIDSKFSLENYNRISVEKNPQEREKLEKLFLQDVKNRIDETSKYIKPKEGTLDYAFMFIPSEAIYYDLLVNKIGSSRDLIEYSFREKHVIIVSPTSFMAYLQTVLQGLRALQIEESAKEIRKNVEGLGKHLMNYKIFMQKLGSSLGTTVGHFTNASKQFKRVDTDIMKITEGKGFKYEVPVLEKPTGEEE